MANLIRFEPFGEMMSLRDAMNSLFEESFVNPVLTRGQNMAMPLDVAETKDTFIVEATLPGVKPEDLDVTIQDNVLTITGETRREQKDGDQPNYHRVERSYGHFSRSISLPTQVDAAKISATLEHGVLHLDLPKVEAVKPHKIAIQASSKKSEHKQIEVESGQSASNGR